MNPTPYNMMPHPAANEIWYTSSDGSVVTPVDGKFADGEGNQLSVVSNTYSDGKGVITLDGGLAAITGSAFYGRGTLVEVCLPPKVSAIGNSAFENCSGLRFADLGVSVANMGFGVFRGCGSMEFLFCPTEVPPVISSSTLPNNDTCVFVVPTGSEGKYGSDKIWSTVAGRLEPCYVDSTVSVEVIGGVTYLTPGYGKSIYCTYNGLDYGHGATLGLIFYDSKGEPLPEPYELTLSDFAEIDRVSVEEEAEGDSQDTDGSDDRQISD